MKRVGVLDMVMANVIFLVVLVTACLLIFGGVRSTDDKPGETEAEKKRRHAIEHRAANWMQGDPE